MRKSALRSTVSASLLMLFWCTGFSAPIITDLSYDLATLSDAELEADWTPVDGGSARVGIYIDSNNNTLFYQHTSLDLTDNNAFLFDAVVSGSALSADGELGARMWAKFRQTGMPPTTFYSPEVRFVRQSGAYRVDLVDGANGSVMASLDKDWTTVAPRYQVRFGHQQTGGIDYVIFQADEPTQWDSFGRLMNPDATNSVSIPLSSFGIMPGSGEFGFGNVKSSIYYSAWESLRIIHSNEAGTLLPQVPVPPAVWLFGSGLVGLIGISRRNKST